MLKYIVAGRPALAAFPAVAECLHGAQQDHDAAWRVGSVRSPLNTATARIAIAGICLVGHTGQRDEGTPL